MLPTLWFRNVWSWGGKARQAASLRQAAPGRGGSRPSRPRRAVPVRRGRQGAPLHRKRNQHRAAGSGSQPQPLRQGRLPQVSSSTVNADAVNPGPDRDESRGALRSDGAGRRLRRAPVAAVRRRRRRLPPHPAATRTSCSASAFEDVLTARRQEADEFYATVIPASLERGRGQCDAPGSGRHALVQAVLLLRCRTSGSKSTAPTRSSRRQQAARNDHWHHMYNADILSMPDKWEYPWYAAWDLAFHVSAADAGGSRTSASSSWT